MTDFTTQIETHYHRPNLFEDILNRLGELNIDLNNVQRKDIAGVDEFHVRGAQVSKELAERANIKNIKVLDVGCGIGGPSRMLAAEYDCTVTGIDLSSEFIRTAIELSKLVGLSDMTNFIAGNALNLPIKNNTFDAVWTQHVQMNIEDKTKFYSEIQRVLGNDGTFIYYDIFKKGDEEVSYPMPWANEPEISFLSKINEMDSILSQLDFHRVYTNDETQNGVIFFENLLEKIKKSGPPKLGLNVLMGQSTKSKIVNLLNALKEGKLELQSGIYRIE